MLNIGTATGCFRDVALFRTDCSSRICFRSLAQSGQFCTCAVIRAFVCGSQTRSVNFSAKSRTWLQLMPPSNRCAVARGRRPASISQFPKSPNSNPPAMAFYALRQSSHFSTRARDPFGNIRRLHHGERSCLLRANIRLAQRATRKHPYGVKRPCLGRSRLSTTLRIVSVRQFTKHHDVSAWGRRPCLVYASQRKASTCGLSHRRRSTFRR